MTIKKILDTKSNGDLKSIIPPHYKKTFCSGEKCPEGANEKITNRVGKNQHKTTTFYIFIYLLSQNIYKKDRRCSEERELSRFDRLIPTSTWVRLSWEIGRAIFPAFFSWWIRLLEYSHLEWFRIPRHAIVRENLKQIQHIFMGGRALL